MEETSVYTYWMYYGREGAMAYLAHLDTMRTFERSLRRAKIPLLWSKGFNPRPALVFALPIGLGIECRNDIVEMSLTQSIDEQVAQDNISAKMPRGLWLNKIEAKVPSKKSLMSLVVGAEYAITGAGLGVAFTQMCGREEPLVVQRRHKGKTQYVDVFALIESYTVRHNDGFAVRVKAGSRENLRPDVLLKAMAELFPSLQEDIANARIVREQLFLDSD